MCGIAGFIGDKHPDEASSVLQVMTRALARRGPDSEGFHHWPTAHLGHRRLAIIDLSEAGRQPMLSDDGRIGIVFNGCIYNFLELRAELENLGHRFRSNCDTEILVRGYEQWGIQGMAPRLRGMFAVGIWDENQRKLSLIRDRLGVKPLVYALTPNGIAFASTVQALAAGGFAGELNPAAITDYLEFGYVSDAHTIYEGIQKLPAATILEWQAGRPVRQNTYWTLPDIDENSRITFDEAVEETEKLLLESVKLRLFADVPIGALLSGGIDSTLVCWAMSKLNANVTAFTVGTPGDPEDEAAYTVETARMLGIPHQIVTLPEHGGEMLQDLTEAYGEPFGCQSALAMLEVSEAVKSHATVLLTGDGGDDIFLGYSFHRDCLWAQQAARRLPSFTLPAWRTLRPLADMVPSLRRPKHFLDYATGGLGAMTRANNGLPYYEHRQMLGARLAGINFEPRQIPLSMNSARSLMKDFLNYQQRMWFVSEFMTKVDGGCMFHALEARSPFLDHTIWDFAAKLPPQLRLRDGVLKAILREIVRRRVSPEVATRRKQGFSIPVERWLLTRWKGSLDAGLSSSSRLEKDGWIRPGSLEKMKAEVTASGSVPRQAWFLVVLDQWMRSRQPAPQTALKPALTSS